MELAKKHRPKRLKDLHGQTEAVNMVLKFLKEDKVPHAILLTGPSGCGKTTVARILKDKLGCSNFDFEEKNSSSFRGIDTIRDIESRMGLATLSGGIKIWLLDEVHQLTSQAQDAMLKMLEEPPQHVYFMLATTDPGKLKAAIKTRCTELRMVPLKPAVMMNLLLSVLEKEDVTVSKQVLEKIVEVADGSPRKALVVLNQVYLLESEEQQLNAVQKCDAKQQSIMLARALLNPRGRWPEVCEILKNIEEEPETLRRMVLGYANTVLLDPKSKLAARAYLLITIFRDHLYDCGKAGLAAYCYEVYHAK